MRTKTKYPKRLRLVITESHAKRGKRGSNCECPAALALRKRFPLGKVLLVNAYPGSINGPRYRLGNLADLIHDFDSGKRGSRAALVGTYTLTRIDP